jgi:hypothetical protein
MTSGAFIFLVAFCLAVGLFAIFGLHHKDDSSDKKHHN